MKTVAPISIPLWKKKLINFKDYVPAETVDENGLIGNVSEPTISVYLPQKNQGTGIALIIFAGGGYEVLDWKTHVIYSRLIFNPKGVAVIGLKYRTRPPYLVSNEGIQAIALQDAKRAIRIIRHRAEEWHLDSTKIGIAGYSAGANLAMNLAANFDSGDVGAIDPIARESCRPDFVIGLATWHWQKKKSPFTFRRDTPPVFLVHATDDNIAPIELPRAIENDLKMLGVPVHMEVFGEGGHGVGDLIPLRINNDFSPAKWPDLFMSWLQGLPSPSENS
jgi:acetyl esterase/lipase